MSLRPGSSPPNLSAEAPGNHSSPRDLAASPGLGLSFHTCINRREVWNKEEIMQTQSDSRRGQAGLGGSHLAPSSGQRRFRRAQIIPFLPGTPSAAQRAEQRGDQGPGRSPQPCPQGSPAGAPGPALRPPWVSPPSPSRGVPQRLHSRLQAGTSRKVPAPHPTPAAGRTWEVQLPVGQLRFEACGPRDRGLESRDGRVHCAFSPPQHHPFPGESAPCGAGLGAGVGTGIRGLSGRPRPSWLQDAVVPSPGSGPEGQECANGAA